KVLVCHAAGGSGNYNGICVSSASTACTGHAGHVGDCICGGPINCGTFTLKSCDPNNVKCVKKNSSCTAATGGCANACDFNGQTSAVRGGDGCVCNNGTCGACIPKTTCPAGQNCGTAPDGCGGLINCGTCTAPQTCGGGGTPNVCGCTANCTGKCGGPDG